MASVSAKTKNELPLTVDLGKHWVAIETPFSARAIDVTSDGILYAVDWDGVIWSTTDNETTWMKELDTNPRTNANQYRSIIVASNDNVHVAVGATGIWRKNSSGWHQTFNEKVHWGVWHFAENPLTGDLYLQTHDRIIYNSTDCGNSWQIMYNMTTQDSPPIDDHFHTIAFDNATQTLWTAGGDTIDIIRRWNANIGWEIVASGMSRNKGQPTSIMFDDNFAYFGPDAQPYVFRLNKSITAPASESDFEAVLTFDSTVWPDCQWSWECKKIGQIYYMATCYNHGIMYVSIDGIHWISVFEENGYYLEGYGEPVDSSPTTKGGIPSLSNRLPLYFIHNTKIYLLDITTTDIMTLWSQKFIDETSDKVRWQSAIENGTNYVYLGRDNFRSIELTLRGATVYENIENRTFEPNQNGGWTENGYGTITVTDEDRHTGSWCLKDTIPAGNGYASIIYPPDAQSWQIQSKGSGQYFWSIWLKTNITRSDTQPKSYMTIAYRQNLTIYRYPVRIDMTTSWTQFAQSIYVPENADEITCWISIYRENGTPRTVYLDDAMFWGPLKTSLVSRNHQRFLPLGYTNNWSLDASEYSTGNTSVTIGKTTYFYSFQLSNGSSSTTWNLLRHTQLFHSGILEFNASMLGPPDFSGQCIIEVEAGKRHQNNRAPNRSMLALVQTMIGTKRTLWEYWISRLQKIEST